MGDRPMKASHQQGFILPVTLWVIVGTMVAVAFVGKWNDGYMEQVLQQQAQFEQRLREDSLLAVLKFNLNKNEIVLSGLPIDSLENNLALDGSVYNAGQGLYFSLQDSSGLVNLHYTYGPSMPGLLESLGVSPLHHRAHISRLSDFNDFDDERRVGGAEKLLYQLHNKPPPPNRVVLTVMEVFRVYGWDVLETPENVEWLRRYGNTWNQSGGINVNTAPREVLMTIPWLNKQDVEKLLSERELNPFRNQRDLKARLVKPDLDIDDIFYGYLPGEFLKVKMWVEGKPVLTELTMRLTPGALQAKPWLVGLRHEYPNYMSEENAEAVAILDI